MNKLKVPDRILVGIKRTETEIPYYETILVYRNENGEINKSDWGSFRKSVKDVDNIPLEGFVLLDNNKCIVQDPRGWSVNISLRNLLYILKHYNYDKDKGFLGKFVYSWNGRNLVLLPTNSEAYKDSIVIDNKSFKSINIPDLNIGVSYLHTSGKVYTYLGSLSLYHLFKGRVKVYLFYRDRGNYKFYINSISNEFNLQKNKTLSKEECDKLIIESGIENRSGFIKDPGKDVNITEINIVNDKEMKTLSEYKKDFVNNIIKNYIKWWDNFLIGGITYDNFIEHLRNFHVNSDNRILVQYKNAIRAISLSISNIPRVHYLREDFFLKFFNFMMNCENSSNTEWKEIRDIIHSNIDLESKIRIYTISNDILVSKDGTLGFRLNNSSEEFCLDNYSTNDIIRITWSNGKVTDYNFNNLNNFNNYNNFII